MQNLQLDTRYFDGVALGEVAAQRACGLFDGEAEHVALFLLQVQQKGVVFVGFCLDAKNALRKGVAQHVIQVQVGVHHVANLEVVAVDVAFEGVALASVRDAGVNQNGLFFAVAEHVTVDAKGVYGDLLDFHRHKIYLNPFITV